MKVVWSWGGGGVGREPGGMKQKGTEMGGNPSLYTSLYLDLRATWLYYILKNEISMFLKYFREDKHMLQ